MEVLGSIGQLYMFLLLVVMVMGFGLAAWSAINFIVAKKSVKVSTPTNIKQNTENKNIKDQIIQNKKILGGLIMKSNGFFKLAVFSLVGIFVSSVILTFTGNMNNSNYQNGMNMQGVNTMSNMQGSNMQGSNMQGMSGQSTMNGQMNMNNQSSASGQMNMGNQSDSLANIQNQLQMMEQQIIQIQQYIQNGNMNSSLQQNSNSSGSGSMSMPATPAAPAQAPMSMPMM